MKDIINNFKTFVPRLLVYTYIDKKRNRKELKQAFKQKKVPFNRYCLTGGKPEDTIVLGRFLFVFWICYYVERGKKIYPRVFLTQSQACYYYFYSVLESLKISNIFSTIAFTNQENRELCYFQSEEKGILTLRKRNSIRKNKQGVSIPKYADFAIPIQRKFYVYPDQLSDLVNLDKLCKWLDSFPTDFCYFGKNPFDIANSFSLLSFAIDFDLNYEELKQALVAISKSQKERESDIVFSDEEIEAIASKNIEKCRELFPTNTSVRVDNLCYSPYFVLENSFEYLDEIGIKAEELLDKSDMYDEIPISTSKLTSLTNKVLEYVDFKTKKEK